jgi:Holliday junction DNA helicase RuvA
MIGFLRGTLVSKHPPELTLDVGGVGYELEAPMSTFYQLPNVGEPITILTHFLVREDAQLLYGFSTEPERALFRNLLKVSGVGGRVALGILSGISVEGFSRCVLDRDLVTLTRIPGIGRKTAERLLVEMKDRLNKTGIQGSKVASIEDGAEGQAYGALLALGYKAAEVSRMLSEIDKAQMGPEDLIREALKRVHAR